MHKKIAISIVVYKKYDDALEAVKSIEENTNPILDKIIYIIDNSCLEDNNITRVEFENCLLTYRDVVYWIQIILRL